MANYLMNSLRFFFVLLLCFLLGSCSSGLAGGFEAYQSSDGRYGFFYPTGWTRVAVSGGPEVVFHDLINSDETLSLVISNIDDDSSLDNIGSAETVGKRLIDTVIAPNGSGRTAELVEAKEREESNHVFYDIEYSLHLPDKDRHELATVVIDRGSLFTLAAGTNESRWPIVKDLFARVITSFSFFI